MKFVRIFWACVSLATWASAEDLLAEDYAPGILYVTFRPGAIDSLWEDSTGFTLCGVPYIDSINRANNCQDFRFIGHPALPLSVNDYHVIFPDSADVSALATAYQAEPKVRWARPDYYVEFQFTPTDSYFVGVNEGTNCYQWNLHASYCNFEKAWDITRGDTGVVIAVIDGGFFYNHPDIQENLWINAAEDVNHNGAFDSVAYPAGDIDTIDQDGNGFKNDVIGYNFPRVGPPNPFIPLGGHGTFAASIAGAVTDNYRGVSGAAFNCRLMLISTGGIDPLPSVTSVIARSVEYAAKMRPAVLNMSWTVPPDSGLILAIDTAFAKGIVLVAAAGNHSSDFLYYPATSPKVLGIAGLRKNNIKDPKSNFNDSLDLAAYTHAWACEYKGTPPQPIYNYGRSLYCWDPPCGPEETCPEWDTLVNPSYGTSWAAPMVVGAAALVKSAYPNMTNVEIMAKLKSSTDSIDHINGNKGWPWEHKMGSGRVNAFKAVTFFGNIPNAANDTTLSGTVYVSGDITVRNGKTLRLAAGTLLRFYPGDVMKKGVDIAKTEIVVEPGGKLIIEGTPGNPVKLVSFRKDPDSTTTEDWHGMVVKPGGYISVNNAIIRHAYAGIEDSSRYLHTIQNVRIGRCKMYGILAVNTDSLTIQGCRVDSINANPGGWGIYVDTVYSGGKGARLVKDTVWASYKGMYIEGSTAPVETCVVQGTAGWLPSHTGIVTLQQVGSDTLRITATKINGYFANQHLENGLNGRVIVSACSLISPSSPSRSPYAIRSTANNTYLRLRGSRLFEWQDMGVYLLHNNGQVVNLGSVPDSGFNVILTGSTSSNWKYVYDGNCSGCSTPVIKAEWNCWGANPLSSRFSTNIDRTPLDYSCAEAPPKIAAEQEKEVLPEATALYQNYPNPFNPTTQIQFSLQRAEKVHLEIFNILGQKVRTLLGGEEFAAGPYSFLWDGKDNRGSPLSSGMYFYRLQTPTYLKTNKMMLIK